MTSSGRADRLGVHSIGEFQLSVPSLADAQRFYEAFGLDVQAHAGGLSLRTHGSPHVWGQVRPGRVKRLEGITFHCFESDWAALQEHVCNLLPMDSVQFHQDAMSFRTPDGVAVNVRVGNKTTLDALEHVGPAVVREGARTAPYKSAAQRVHPTRLSHIAIYTTSVPAQIEFFTRVLGLRLSDRSGDNVAFLHAPHGGDHHLIALVNSTGPGLHHFSWDVPSMDAVGMGAAQMQAAGFDKGWGVGRHVLGSNYFYYAQDPWGSFCEYSAHMDYIPATADWEPIDHPGEEAFYLWGPEVPEAIFINSEDGHHRPAAA